MLSTNDLAARFNVSPATIFRWRSEGSLPAPLSLSKTTVRWREEDIRLYEQWLLDRANADEPDSIQVPNYTLPTCNDAHSMARERMAASFEAPSSMRSYIESLGDDMTKLAAEAAIIASKSVVGQLSEASRRRLRETLPTETKQWLLDELPPANAARLQEILS